VKVAVFSTKPYEERFFQAINAEYGHDITYFEPRLTADTAPLADDFPAICAFVNDQLDNKTIAHLAETGTRLIALRSAGFNNVDLKAAEAQGITVVRVPAYSPYAVAEHAVGLLLTLNRKIHRAHNRVREGNFALDGLLGFDIYGLTVGCIGTGRIGREFVRIMKGFGCEVLAYDPYPSEEVRTLGARYVDLSELFAESDIVSLHCPLTPETYHIINPTTIRQMKDSVTIINTSRGALVDTLAVIDALKEGHIGYLALDVYEEEADLFFEDLSDVVIQDDVFARLLTFPNVLITGHQAFFTREALNNIVHTTLANIREFEQTGQAANSVTAAIATG
jgi:D-lactate dehydrogenase